MPLAPERDRLLVGTVGAAQPNTYVDENATLEKGVELVVHGLGQGRAGSRIKLSEQGLQAFPYQLIQDGPLGTATFGAIGLRQDLRIGDKRQLNATNRIGDQGSVSKQWNGAYRR